jgi:predicted Zn-dependent peptidase
LINTEVERYLAVTPADIQRVASTYYTPDQRVTLYFLQQQP